MEEEQRPLETLSVTGWGRVPYGQEEGRSPYRECKDPGIRSGGG
jgi:hypothetical protein